MGRLLGDAELILVDRPVRLKVDLGQFGQRVEFELVQELLGRSIEHGPTRRFAPPNLVDEPALEERAHTVIALNPTDLLDFGQRERLTIGDDREDLEEGSPQLLTLGLEKVRNALRVFRLRAELIASGDPNDLKSTDAREPILQDLECLLGLALGHPCRPRQVRKWNRRIRDEQDGLERFDDFHARKHCSARGYNAFMFRLGLAAIALTLSAASFAQLTADERKGIERALYVGNLSPQDLEFARRPYSDKYRIPLINLAIDKPLDTADTLMGIHANASKLGGSALLDLARKQILGDTLPQTLALAPAPTITLPKDVPPSVQPPLQALASSLATANASVRQATSKLDPTKQRLLLESLPQWATEEPSIKFEFVTKAMAPQAEILSMLDQVDLRLIFEAAASLAKEVERQLPELRRLSSQVTWTGSAKFKVGDMQVVVAGVGDDTHRDRDARLVIDLGGNDRYYGRGGAGVGFAALQIDCGGDDFYKLPDVGAGCGLLGIGLAYDLGGHDNFRGKALAFGAGLAGVGVFYKDGGDDSYQSEALTQGFGEFGIGLLLDTRGSDLYEAKLYGQGSARTAGVGWLVDQKGDDTYRAGGLILNSPLFADVHYSFAQGYGGGYREDTGGVSGGVGLLTDVAGDDAYVAETYAQAASYWYSLGSLYDASGMDTYRAYHYAQASAMHMCAAYLFELAGDDSYIDNFGAAHAIGHDYGVAMLFDRAGNDVYAGRDSRPGIGNANGLGLFVDAAGEDRYSGPPGVGNPARGSGSLGVFVDLDGPDQYRDGLADGEAAARDGWGVAYDVESKPVEVAPPTDPAQAAPKPGSEAKPDDKQLEELYKKATQWGVGTAQKEVRQATDRLIAIGQPALQWMVEKHLAAASRLEQRAFVDVANGVGPEGRTLVAGRIASENEAEALVALMVCIEASATEAAPFVPKALKSQALQRVAARAAGVVGSKESLPDLQLLAASTEDKLAALNAVVSLVQLADPTSMGTAQALLASPELPIRKAAVTLVAKFPEALSVGKGLTTDPDERRARTGVEILGAIGSEEALNAIGPYLTDERPGMRIQALLAMNGRAPGTWKQAVLDRRKDPNDQVRAVAMRIDPGR